MTKTEHDEFVKELNCSVKRYSELIKEYSNQDLLHSYEQFNRMLGSNRREIFATWYKGMIEVARKEILSRMK